MIIAETNKPSLSQFNDLMSMTTDFLNREAAIRPNDFLRLSGQSLEPVVANAAIECARETVFENTIRLVSGSKFPDIVAARYYGIEVKSTNKDHWTSIGGSILESTRIDDVERIYITFGKLHNPVQFISRPYEDCLSGISVTHYPRYQIDMMLKQGNTIFDKLGIPYDELRRMDNPVRPVSDYFRSQLQPGESLWWIGDNIDQEVPASVKLWTSLTAQEKDLYEARSYVYFPECIMSNTNKKYNNAVLWLATQCGIINSNVRDSFSAGGRVQLKTLDMRTLSMPAVFGKIKNNINNVLNILLNSHKEQLCDCWREPIKRDRISQWINLIISYSNNEEERKNAKSVLFKIIQEAQ